MMAGSDEAKKDTPDGSTVASSRRRAIGQTNLWLASALVVAIVAMLNYLSYRHYERWDWTESERFTLSDRTEKVLGELSRPVDVYVFLSQMEPNFDEMRELLQRYGAGSDRIQAHYVDPDKSPGEYQTLLRKFGVQAAQLETGQTVADVAAVVSSGDNHWRINRRDLMSFDMGSPGKPPAKPEIDVKTEQALTGAILQVTEGRATKVCLTEGHGEWSSDGSGERSLWAVEEELKRSNTDSETIATRGKAKIPDDCDAVLVVGPTRAFSEEEAELLAKYVRGGGGLLLALDPVLEHERVQATGLESMARDFGIRIDPNVVLELDAARLVSPSPLDAFLVTEYADHETTQIFQGPTILSLARSVRATDEQKATGLLMTSEAAYGESDLASLDPQGELEPDSGDVEGPLELAAAYEQDAEEEGDRKGRLVVVGDSDFLRGEFLDRPQFANADLMGAWVGWLTERKALVSIAPRKVDAGAMLMTEDDLASLGFRVLVLLPAAVLLLGFAVWWSRRS